MKTHLKISLSILLLSLLAACSSGTSGPSSSSPTLAVGDKAPDFTMPDANEKPVSLAQFRGKKAVLLFFSMGPG